MSTKKTSLAAILGLVSAGSAPAANLVGLFETGAGYSIGTFDSGDPSLVAFAPVTGVSAGEQLLGIDYRPATGDLYVISSLANVYTVSRATGAVSGVGSYAGAVPGATFGFDFNPAFMGGTFARIISDTNDNRVISGADGTYLAPIEKTDVFYAPGDPNEGADPEINHIAYTNSVPGATSTQQYGIDTNLDVLTTVANNDGTLVTVGALGIDAGALGGFDIVGASGQAFAAFQNIGVDTSTLYSIDLVDGSATPAGELGGRVVGLAAVPEPSAAFLLGVAGSGFCLCRRRRGRRPSPGGGASS